MAAIFNLPITPTLESVHTSSAVLFDPEIVGVAFKISFPSCVQAEIHVFQVYRPPSWISPLPVASGIFISSSIEMAVYENGRVAVEILSLSCTAAEILLGSFRQYIPSEPGLS